LQISRACGNLNLNNEDPRRQYVRQWLSASIALHRLDGLEKRLQGAIKRSKELFASLDIKVSALGGGANIYSAKFPLRIDGQKLTKELQIVLFAYQE